MLNTMLRTTLLISGTLMPWCVAKAPSIQQLGTVSILASDSLITGDAKSASAALLLHETSNHSVAEAKCTALGETLWNSDHASFNAGLNQSLSYEVFAGRTSPNQLYWTQLAKAPHADSEVMCSAVDAAGHLHKVFCDWSLPALCTQSAPASNITFADTSAKFQIAQEVGRQTLIGYRDYYTFRYMGVRFAEEPERFTYSSPFNATGEHTALQPAPECLQLPNNGSTDCLFLNIWTTSLPASKSSSKAPLEPVMVYIYGGGFTTGSASNPTNDGGNLAARGDVVVVDIAYRLSTLGFLPFNDGVHNGNYWLSDCISGLRWVQQNIEFFGGDPNHITIFGESAGAESVQTLLESPAAAGLFNAAILQSDYYEPAVPLVAAFNKSTLSILQQTGCDKANSPLKCLQQYDAVSLLSLSTIANYPVIDGKYLTQPLFNFNGSNPKSKVNSVPLLMGVNRDEGGVLAPLFNTSDLDTGIRDLGLAEGYNVSKVISSGAFPLGHGPEPLNQTLNVFNTTTRIYTDAAFRCQSQYIAYGGVKSGVIPDIFFYEFNRTYQDPGYDTNGVCRPAPSKSHPYGDPSKEYFKCHAGDLAYTFGNVARVGFPIRDENDIPFMQLVTDYWTAFGRTFDPNPDPAFLKARGYWNTLSQIAVSGPWPKVEASQPKMMELQWNSYPRPFRDAKQCAVLEMPLTMLV